MFFFTHCGDHRGILRLGFETAMGVLSQPNQQDRASKPNPFLPQPFVGMLFALKYADI